MNTFGNLSYADIAAPDCIITSSQDRLSSLARLTAETSEEEYFSLGYPETVLRISPNSDMAHAFAPELDRMGAIPFKNSLNIFPSDYFEMSDKQLSHYVTKLLTASERYSPRCAPYTSEQRQKISSQHDLCTFILQLHRKKLMNRSMLYPEVEDEMSVGVTFDHQLVSTTNVLTPFWHMDHQGMNYPGDTINFVVRAFDPKEQNIATEFIRDSRRLLSPEARDLLHEIDRKQIEAAGTPYNNKRIYPSLGEEVYSNWRLRLEKLGVFFKGEPLDVVASTIRTRHRSDVPKSVMPASFLRITIIPVVPTVS